jgi:hypothetical protein
MLRHGSGIGHRKTFPSRHSASRLPTGSIIRQGDEFGKRVYSMQPVGLPALARDIVIMGFKQEILRLPNLISRNYPDRGFGG